MKQLVLVGIVAGALVGSAYAQEGGHKAPNEQPAVAPAPNVQVAEVPLGSARIPRNVTADGKPLPSGVYTLRVTTEESKPAAVGQTPALERWVEFLQSGKVRGREVASIIPQEEVARIAKDTAPRPGAVKVELLRGGDYYRLWFNKAGVHYLVYLPPSGAPAAN